MLAWGAYPRNLLVVIERKPRWGFSECCGTPQEEQTDSMSFTRLLGGKRQKGWDCLGQALAQLRARRWGCIAPRWLRTWRGLWRRLLCAMNGCFMLTSLRWLFLIPNSNMRVLEQCLSRVWKKPQSKELKGCFEKGPEGKPHRLESCPAKTQL